MSTPLKLVAVRVTSEGSEVVSLKNHSNRGVGIPDGRGKGATRFVEHVNEEVSPAVLDPEEEIDTGLFALLVVPNSTACTAPLCM